MANPNNIIESLENRNYLKQTLNPNEMKTKIHEFSEWFNTAFKAHLMSSNRTKTDDWLFTLINLKHNINGAIKYLEIYDSTKPITYICSACNEKIVVERHEDTWVSLQNHEHFEEMFCDYLESIKTKTLNDSDIKPIEDVKKVEELPETSVVNPTNNFKFNFDFENNNKPQTSTNSLKLVTQTSSEETDELPQTSNNTIENPRNTFKFNFKIEHDNVLIKDILYPTNQVDAIKQVDLLNWPSVQVRGANSRICLICLCPIMSTSNRVSKHLLFEHVSGRKHLKFAVNQTRISALKKYHTSWQELDGNCQAHQVYFIPFNVTITKCLLCNLSVEYKSLTGHINNEDNHKSRLLRFIKSGEARDINEKLLGLQTAVYGIEMNVKSENKDVNFTRNKKVLQAASCCIKTAKEWNGKLEDIIPERFIQHLDLLTIKNDQIYCKYCEVKLTICPKILLKHLQTNNHLKLKGYNSKLFTYNCDICNKKFTDEKQWEKHFQIEQEPHNLMSENRKLLVKEYECITCSIVIFGDDISLYRHNSSVARLDTKRKIIKKKELILPHPVKVFLKSKKFILNESNNVMIEANQVLKNRNIVSKCLEQIQKAVIDIFPRCQAYPFGSRISGLGNEQSDLDIFLDVGGMYLGDKSQDHVSQEQFVKTSAKLLKKYEEFSYIYAIPSARTPIVKLYHRPTDLNCDISFRHGLSVENTKFITFCINLQPITQPFILMLKIWSLNCNLSENITNYALALMGIYFLQQNGYLLSVTELRKHNSKPSLIIDGWETIFYSVPVDDLKKFVKLYPNDLYHLLTEFFYYFANFDYATQVICPLLGYHISKNLFIQPPEGKSLPVEMISYTKRVKSDENELFRALAPFCIQDPFDLSHNLTKACSLGLTRDFKTLCELTYQHLSKID